MVVFRKDIVQILGNLITKRDQPTLIFSRNVILSMIPAGIVGLFFEEQVSRLFEGRIMLVSILLFLNGLILLSSRIRPPGQGAITGTKAFISGGGYSDVYVVMVRTGTEGPKGISTIIVEEGTPGLSFGGLEDKMGWRAQPTAQVQFDDCLVPAQNLLGEEGKGFRYAMAGLDGGRLNIAASALGGAQAALDATLAYMGERKAFGTTLDQFQALQFKVAELEVKLQSARTFLRQAAWKLDRGDPDATKFCAMAKMLVTDNAFDVANQCLQLHGGYGYLADYGIEKIVRDLRVHQILEGTNEIMRLIVARALLAERG